MFHPYVREERFMGAQVEVDGDTFLSLAMAKSAVDYFTKGEVNEVVIDRYAGLTIYDTSGRPLLHATGLVCGYNGTGPSGSIEVLRYAGFSANATLDEWSKLVEQVHTEPTINLKK